MKPQKKSKSFLTSLPGDLDVTKPYWVADQKIVMQAKPEEIWPWIVQMGNGRAGWYSYDWIDNLGKKSFDYLDPQLQRLEKGQKITVFEVDDFKKPDYLTLKISDKANMTWALNYKNEVTEIFTRVRVKGPKILLSLTLGPAHYIMQRKQFIELKKRVEK